MSSEVISAKAVSIEEESAHRKKAPHLRDPDARVRQLAKDVASTLSQLNPSTAVGSDLLTTARLSEIELKATQAQSFLNQVTFNQSCQQKKQSLMQLENKIRDSHVVTFASSFAKKPVLQQKSAELLKTLTNGQRRSEPSRSSTLNSHQTGVSMEKIPKFATLRDGSQMRYSSVAIVTITLRKLFIEHLVAFIDLVEKCKDPKYKFVVNPFGDSKSILKEYGLINEDEEVHERTKTIVLNSIEGEGLSVKLVNPIQDKK